MSSHRIKVYLEQHRIGALFEDMMSRLISDMPNEPLPFLIRILQKKIYQTPQTVMNVPQLRRSLGNLSSALEIERLPIQHKPSSAVVRRHQRPLTPSVSSAPKKSVTICYPLRGGKTLNISRLATPVKQVKTVATGPTKHEDTTTHGNSLTVADKFDFGFDSHRGNSPGWLSGGYNGPIIPGAVFIEDPFKDEVIDVKRHETKSTSFSYSQDYSQKILDSIISCSKSLPNGSEKTLGNSCNSECTLIQAKPCELTVDTIDPMEAAEELPNVRAVNGEHWHFNICSVCAKVMDFHQSLNKDEPCQSQHMSSKSLGTSDADVAIPLLKIPKETSSVKDDLFSSIRSLPLPKSPIKLNLHSESKNWCESTLESLYASGNGWKM